MRTGQVDYDLTIHVRCIMQRKAVTPADLEHWIAQQQETNDAPFKFKTVRARLDSLNTINLTLGFALTSGQDPDDLYGDAGQGIESWLETHDEIGAAFQYDGEIVPTGFEEVD